jgi:putative DNA primase/helicase
MNFEDFARAYGLLLNNVIPGRWVSVPTEDHPRKRNGRYKLMGNVGWVQNWATMSKPEMWRSEGAIAPTIDWRREQRVADQKRFEEARKAAQKAGWIMHQTEMDRHPYLARKGFPDELGNVWDQDGERVLVVPMRMEGRLVGCQLIGKEGGKKFLTGQRTKGASFILDAKGIPIFVEGYATALSVRAAMKAMKVRYTIHVCFSAGNIKQVASVVPGGVVVADKDLNGIGEQAARETGKPYWTSDTVGEDFNDFHIRVGLFHASSSLRKFLFDNARDSIAS